MSLRRRRWRLALGGTAAALGASVIGVLAGGTSATGAPTGVSPLVYVAAGNAGAGLGQVDAFRLANIASGGPLSAAQSDDVSSDGVPAGLAITRDSTRAVIIENQDGITFLVVVDTSSGTFGAPIDVASGGEGIPEAVATDPADSSLVYVLTAFALFAVNIDTAVVSEVVDIDTALTVEKSPFVDPIARSLAVSADGTTAYIGAAGLVGDGDGEAILEVSLVTANPPVTAWFQAAPPGAARVGVVSLALTPSGSEIFACDRAEVFALHLPVSPSEAAFDVVGMLGVESVTVGPHGKNVYAGVINANEQAMVEAFAVTAPTKVSFDSLQSTSFPLSDPAEHMSLAATANGGTLLVTVTRETDAGALAPCIFAVSLGGVTASGSPVITLGPGLPLPSELAYPVTVAITPDQAPHASFTASLGLAGSSSSFNAASSTVKYGSVVSYAWTFGDGTGVSTTSSDTTTHVFASAGTYTVRVVERDSAGTTIPPAFGGTPGSWVANGPGQTPYRLSSTLAETTRMVTIKGKHHPTKPGKKKKPSLTIEPTVGPPGSIVTVTGRNFPNNAIVTIEWSSPNAASTAEKVKVHNGGFVTQLLVLVPDLLGPRQALAVSFPKVNRPTFLVVADSEEPGGPNATPVFRSEGP
ncbi:MAG: PKD domain-containing protein [Acidimicrobiales bacterium]